MEPRSWALFGAIALAAMLVAVPARAAQAITSDVPDSSISTPVCSYGRLDVASLDDRPGMEFFPGVSHRHRGVEPLQQVEADSGASESSTAPASSGGPLRSP